MESWPPPRFGGGFYFPIYIAAGKTGHFNAQPTEQFIFLAISVFFFPGRGGSRTRRVAPKKKNFHRVASVTVLEVRFGLQVMAPGRRKTALVGAFEAALNVIGQRVLAFDVDAAEQAGDLLASRQKRGRPGDLRDTMIAGIALAQHATLATRNTAHFSDLTVPLVNPWTQK